LEYNDSFSQQDLDELFQLLPSAHNTAVVEFYLTTKSILAFVLHGNGHIQDVIEIEMGEAELNGFVDLHFLQPCRQFFHHDTALHVDENWQQWITGLDTTLSELYILLFATPGKRGHSLAETLSDLGTKKLILVPYGILSLLPLQALYCEENGNRTYLLNKFESVVFTPCLAILKTVLQRPARNFNSLLAIQNPDGSLENADAEVAAISSLFAQTDVLAREQATKQNIIEKLSKAPVVHFACHGAFYMTDPMSSSLILADGELTLAEIYQVHLQPGALVVLSACETGLAGNTFINEYQGLPAGFIYAGAAAIVSSFWKVEDEPTMLLMQHLYRSLKQGSSPAAALREAQLHLRELTIGDTQPYAHPFYWAAFTVNGI
jgi:hypothetical protein